MAVEQTNFIAHQPLLPRDRDGIPMQVLSVQEDTVIQLSIAAGNQRTTLPPDAEVVEVAATDVCRLKFGNASVDATASARVFPGGTQIYKLPPGATHVAITQVGTSSGFVTVARMF
jgi:hypothetical protein